MARKTPAPQITHDGRMANIERCTKAFAEARTELVDRAAALRDELEQVKRRHLKRLKRAVEDTAAAQALLTHAIEAAPDLFERPRSVVFHGIKVGMQKGQDTLSWADARVVAELIAAELPEQRDVLVEVIYKPVAKALIQLDPPLLRKLGVLLTPGKDCVLIKPADGGIDKLVSALLKGMEDEAEPTDAASGLES